MLAIHFGSRKISPTEMLLPFAALLLGMPPWLAAMQPTIELNAGDSADAALMAPPLPDQEAKEERPTKSKKALIGCLYSDDPARCAADEDLLKGEPAPLADAADPNTLIGGYYPAPAATTPKPAPLAAAKPAPAAAARPAPAAVAKPAPAAAARPAPAAVAKPAPAAAARPIPAAVRPVAGPDTSASAPSGPRPVQGCAAWAASGECRANPAFMHTQCLLACQKLEAAPAAAVRPTPAVAARPAAPVVPYHAPVAAVRPAPAAAVRPAPAAAMGPRAQVLVVVSDHGSGTTEIGKALNKHPCVFDIGEPFAYSTTVWSTSVIPECNGGEPDAIFDADTHTLMNARNPELQEKIMAQAALEFKQLKIDRMSLIGETSPLYAGLRYNLADYYVRVRDLVCAGVPVDVCPPAECSITIKLFPQFVNANTAGKGTKLDSPSACTMARNERAMPAWTDALASMAKHPKVAMLKITRNELDRQFSVFHRFTPPGSRFDCTLTRAPSDFMKTAKAYMDDNIDIENCWTDAHGAAKCLNQALSLLGLDMAPMGDKGTAVMAEGSGPGAESGPEKSCYNTPNAIFEVQATGPATLGPNPYANKVAKVGEGHGD